MEHVIQILVGIGMPENKARLQLENNRLNLYHCNREITDTAIISMVENCKGLVSISLNFCRNITDTAVISIAENCSGLTTLYLNSCDKITDASINAIAENCPDMTKLDLNGCKHITDAAIIDLAESCPGLTSIFLSGCLNLTNTSVFAIAENCVNFTSIIIRTDNITDESIIELHANCVYLHHVECYGPKISATGRQLIEEIKTRPKPPPLEEGWWLNDGTEPRCKGMMN